MSKARLIYYKAVNEARVEHARLGRLFVSGKLDVLPCGMDHEREAVIAAFDEAFGHQQQRKD